MQKWVRPNLDLERESTNEARKAVKSSSNTLLLNSSDLNYSVQNERTQPDLLSIVTFPMLP